MSNLMTMDGVVHAVEARDDGVYIPCPNPYGADASTGHVSVMLTNDLVTCIDCLARPLQDETKKRR